MKETEKHAISVRRLSATDASILKEAVCAVQGFEVEEAHLAKLLASDANIIVTATCGTRTVGVLLAYKLVRMSSGKGKIFLYDIEVDEDFRRQGAGRRMVEELISIATEDGCASVFVLTNDDFKGAPEFYMSTGARLENSEELLFVYDL